ncbi:hypothetical protein [Streptomyces sp. NPDC001530]|uniref:hypothetical protein n=1 Tax=Streptomyces sp. NPDC001530 TaxID=3364582 RepID=UPI00367B6E59
MANPTRPRPLRDRTDRTLGWSAVVPRSGEHVLVRCMQTGAQLGRITSRTDPHGPCGGARSMTTLEIGCGW